MTIDDSVLLPYRVVAKALTRRVYLLRYGVVTTYRTEVVHESQHRTESEAMSVASNLSYDAAIRGRRNYTVSVLQVIAVHRL